MKKVIFAILVFSILPSLAVFACSAQGPQDPYTGVISYPPGTGPSATMTTILPPSSDLANTPFAGGEYFKAWSGTDMQFLIVPCGSTLAFEGIIQSTTAGRPPYWEEGEVKGLNAYTIANAPKPVWTVSGNGRGDYRGGSAPPAAAGLVIKQFESPPGCMIVAGGPAPKSVWSFEYDQQTAVNMLNIAWADPAYKTLIISGLQSRLPTMTATQIETFFGDILNAPGNPVIHPEVKSYRFDNDTYWVSAEKLGLTRDDGAVSPMQNEMALRIPQREGAFENIGTQNAHSFKDTATGTPVYTKNLYDEIKVVLKSGYIACQGNPTWYNNGNYTSQFDVTPPSSTKYSRSGSPYITVDFACPTYPDYWVIDCQSGIDSFQDWVWCWIEGTKKPKPPTTVISSATTNIDDYYEWSTDSNDFAIGGVFVRGAYTSGSSSSGRNTLVYVTVIDTQPPASFTWLAPTAGQLKGATGKTFSQSSPAGTSVKFKVLDNNPMLSVTDPGFRKINAILPSGVALSSLAIIEASKKPTGGSDNAATFSRYIIPTQNGFQPGGNTILAASFSYNVCVNSYVGLKGNTAENTPFPTFMGITVVPTQRFVWKTVSLPGANFSNFQLHDAAGNVVTALSQLMTGTVWQGYSSFDVEINPTGLTALNEPMGHSFAQNSQAYTIPFGDSTKGNFVAPASLPTDGTPVFSDGIYFYPWSAKAIKMFPIVTDGSGNQSPREGDVNSILSMKFSGLELPADMISSWTEPTANLTPPATVTPILGGKLMGLPESNWGNFLFLDNMADEGKPNIALEVMNTKIHKAAIYGNLFAGAGQSTKYWQAFAQAATSSVVIASDSNIGEKCYNDQDSEKDDSRWLFDDLTADPANVYIPLQDATEQQIFRPWAYAVPNSFAPSATGIWPPNYWNGGSTVSTSRLAFEHDSRVPVVFRYWTWDNINSFKNDDPTAPNGIALQTDTKYTDVGNHVTAKVTLRDVPTYSGDVPDAQFNWREYTFPNPNNNNEECSIKLEASDGAVPANTRTLKVNFRIWSPRMEIIRTLEDQRQKK
ncbi:MAG: hypothetical protein HQM08_27580 [Candidatus Riflebacteria bacterium]|nr:hypothetical protein [Candidatus Riflebacteria bacterium]